MRPAFIRYFVLGLLLLLASIWALPAHAATPAPGGADLNNLVQTLQNPAARAVLISQIKALMAVQAGHAPAAGHAGPGSGLVELLSGEAMRIGAAVTALARLAPLQALHLWAQRFAADPALRLIWLRALSEIVLVLAVAVVAARATQLALRGAWRRLYLVAARAIWFKLPAVLGLLLLGWLPPWLLLAVGYAALAGLEAWAPVPDTARAALLALLDAGALTGAARALAETPLLAGPDGARLLAVSESTADYWVVWSRRLIRFGVYGWFLLAFAQVSGLDDTAFDLLQKCYALAINLLLVMLILQNRMAVAHAIHGPDRKAGFAQIRARLAQIWHVAAILYLIGAYGIWVSGVPGGFALLLRDSCAALLILATARLLDAGGERLINRFFQVSPALEGRLPGLQQRVNLYAPLVAGTLRSVLGALAILLVLQACGLDVMAWVETRAGQRLLGGLVSIALTASCALGIWEVVSMGCSLYLSRPGADGTPVTRSARARTLLPLMRKTLAILLGTAVVLISLATLGVNIAPLLAGAGIAGIAVGFGAQSLVKDVITGIFILMQDAVSVGDVVAVAGQSGLVEQISIRSIRLRDQSGTVIIIPFSEVTTVQNMTKDFSYALFSMGVGYREDVDEVISVITALAGELAEDADYSWRIIAPVEILGLDQFGDSAVVIKFRIKTLPIQQWTVMREFNRRMKRRFDELNIEIPFPHQTIYFGEDKQGRAPVAHVKMAAAD